jgi:hypothetical protein
MLKLAFLVSLAVLKVCDCDYCTAVFASCKSTVAFRAFGTSIYFLPFNTSPSSQSDFQTFCFVCVSLLLSRLLGWKSVRLPGDVGCAGDLQLIGHCGVF